MPLNPLFMVCKCSLCIDEWIKVKKYAQSLSIMAFDFDLIPLNIFPKIGQIQSFCAHQGFTRIQSYASWILRPETCTKSLNFNVFDFL